MSQIVPISVVFVPICTDFVPILFDFFPFCPISSRVLNSPVLPRQDHGGFVRQFPKSISKILQLSELNRGLCLRTKEWRFTRFAACSPIFGRRTARLSEITACRSEHGTRLG